MSDGIISQIQAEKVLDYLGLVVQIAWTINSMLVHEHPIQKDAIAREIAALKEQVADLSDFMSTIPD